MMSGSDIIETWKSINQSTNTRTTDNEKQNNIGKIDLGSNFPSIYANVTNVTTTAYSSYAKVVSIEQVGITAEIWVEDASGLFVDNMSVVSDYGW